LRTKGALLMRVSRIIPTHRRAVLLCEFEEWGGLAEG